MRERLKGEMRRLWLEPRDPRLPQLAFSLLFYLDFLLRVAGGVDLRTGPLVALVAVPVVWLVTLVLPWARMPDWARVVLFTADIGLVGLSRLDPDGGSGLLVIIPAMWLGYVYGVRGAVVTAASAVTLIALPGLWYVGWGGINLSRSVVIPLLAVAVSLAMANVVARLRGGQETIALQRRVSDAILDTVDVGLVLLEAHGRYATMNRRHHDFMRLAFPQGHAGVAGQLGEVFHEDGETLVKHTEMPTYRASRGEEFDDQLIWVGADPLTRRALSVSSRVVHDEQGAFAGAALAYKDVTDFMRALEVKDEFVASVSHELRTPLTSIHGFTSLVLERDDLPADARQQLEVVERNVHRLDRLVSDLLLTAQVEHGLVDLERRRSDLAAIVRQSVEAARPGVEKAALELSTDVPDQLYATVDPRRFAQVVDNLVSNAVKYTPGGGAIEVTLAVEDGQAELVVADTGIGIGTADVGQVFSRFFRARHASRQSIQGIGLGLSITKAIVDSHGGWIGVESEEGKGSVFRVRLPLDPDPDQDPEPDRDPGRQPSEAPPGSPTVPT